MLTSAMSLLNVEPSKVGGIPSFFPLQGKNVQGNVRPGDRDCCNAQMKSPKMSTLNTCPYNNTSLADTMTRPQSIAMFSRFGFSALAQDEINDNDNFLTVKDMAKISLHDAQYFCSALRRPGGGAGNGLEVSHNV